MHRFIISLCISIFPFIGNAQLVEVDHWEMIIDASSESRYIQSISVEPDSAWNSILYDDGSWNIGFGNVGYGSNNDTFIDEAMAIYQRKTFTITNLDDIELLVLHADYDDAFVAYINGVEVARENIGYAGDPVSVDQSLFWYKDTFIPQDGKPLPFLLLKDEFENLLVEGENTFAVETHNYELSSSDLGGHYWLSAGLTSSISEYDAVPEWFKEPVLLAETNLPIFSIITDGEPIRDDPRIVAQLDIIANASGINAIDDPADHFSGRITIEHRGSSSQKRFQKKSYGFETQDALGENLNVSLLGLPQENDWILYGPYSDKSLFRNVLLFELGRKMGQYAPRCRFVEVVLNGKYEGLYVLMEKIKRDAGRVDIATLKNEDIEGDEITGGYILKMDKTTGSGGNGWFSDYPSIYNEDRFAFFQFEYPDEDDINIFQQGYIQNHFDLIDDMFISDSYDDPINGYDKYIDTKSFIDFFIANEISYNADGYRISQFMYKEKDSDGGKVHMGPLWDFNLSFGNGFDCDGQNTENWCVEARGLCPDGQNHPLFWWDRLRTDQRFLDSLKCHWTDYRSNFLHNDSIYSIIDSITAYTLDAQERNFRRWPIIRMDLWPNTFPSKTYREEVDLLKNWISTRMEWLDHNMPGNCILLDQDDVNSGILALSYPNPVEDILIFNYFSETISTPILNIYSADGKALLSRSLSNHVNGLNYFEIDCSSFPAGIYVSTISSDDFLHTEKFIKSN